MPRSDEEILSWMQQKIDSEANRFVLRLKELNEILCFRVKKRKLEMDKTVPVLNDILMTFDQLHTDIGTLLQPSKPEDKDKKSKKGQDVLSQSPVSVEEGNALSSTLNDNKMCEVTKRMDTVEQKLLAQNDTLLKHVEKLDKNETAAKYIQQRLDSFEQLLVSGELPEKVSHLETEVYPDLLDRVEKLENHIRVVRRSVFGEKDGLAQGLPCVLYQLTDLQAIGHEGQAQLQVMGEKLQRLEDEFEHRDSIAGASKEPGKGSVAFQVCVDLNYRHEDGYEMDTTMSVAYNTGNAFNVEHCEFLAPVTGNYNFDLYVKRCSGYSGQETRFEVWRRRDGDYAGKLLFVTLKRAEVQCSFDKTVYMEEGDSAVVRLFGYALFTLCMFKGQLVTE